MIKRLMKALISICAFAVLVNPAWAEVLFPLDQTKPWTLELTNPPSNNGPVTVTIYYLGTRQTIEALMTVPANTLDVRNFPAPGKNVARVVIEVDVYHNGAALLNVVQGGDRSEIPFTGYSQSGRFVLDVN